MLLIAEIIIIAVLLAALALFLIEENKIKKSTVPRGAVEEYWNGREKRQSVRIRTNLIVRYCLEEKPHIRLNGHMQDISSGGMRLLVTEKLAEGVLLRLEFDLPDSKSIITADGKVVWSDGNFSDRDEMGRRIFHTGIQFVNIKQGDKARLASYIEKIAKTS